MLSIAICRCCSGLECDWRNLVVAGPEGCICGGDQLAIVEPDTSWVCSEGQYCYQDPSVPFNLRESHSCVKPCQEMPAYNSKACFCHQEVCNEPAEFNFCYHNSGCQRFERCPSESEFQFLYNHTGGYGQDSKDRYNLEFCTCGPELCDHSQYCHVEKAGTGHVEHSCCVILNFIM